MQPGARRDRGVSHEVWHDVERFLHREARLLDERRFEEWLELFTDDAVYWMPGRANPWRARDPAASIGKPGELAIFEETKGTLATRIERLRTGVAWAEEPASRTRHLITNIEVEAHDVAGELLVRSNFLVYRAQLERERDTVVGGREDVLRSVDGRWHIARRTIIVEDVVFTTGPLSFFF